ncbi:MAG: TlpA family protein disulfide reductase, partial [Bryobacteraceae bacterium]
TEHFRGYLYWAFFSSLLVAAAGAFAQGTSLVRDVRAAIAANNFQKAEAQIADYEARRRVTPEMLEALSWLGRGALAAKNYDQAEAYASRTRELCLEMLKSRPLDADRNLPIALGAAIEVLAQTAAARGERSAAVAFLLEQLAAYRDTSIRTRIQKNINLLTLEGRRAPPLEISKWVGPRPQRLDQLKGRPVLLFFWAHWCGDCKAQAPVLARLLEEYGPQGLTLVGPTQRYGYVAGGKEAGAQEELAYIDEVRSRFYGRLGAMSVPVSEENFRNYGASTTPTLVLIDRAGVVRLYHPGNLAYEELAPQVAALGK